jgi:ubiquinone biosynthesis protein UbiJ
VTRPDFQILTQQELVIDLSRPAMELIAGAIERDGICSPDDAVQCEVDNFRNMLQNLLDRSEPEPGNLDLIGGD